MCACTNARVRVYAHVGVCVNACEIVIAILQFFIMHECVHEQAWVCFQMFQHASLPVWVLQQLTVRVRVCSSASVFQSSASVFESSASVFKSRASVLKLDYMLRIYKQRNNSYLKVRVKSTSRFQSYKEVHALVKKF